MSTDADLIRRARDGDGAAVAALIASFARLIRFLAKKRLRWRDPGLLADLIQEGEIAVWEAAKTFDFDLGPSFSSWVSRLIKHHMFHHLKHSRSEGWKPTEYGYDFSEVLLAKPPRFEPDEFDELNAMLASLSPSSRALITTHYGLDGEDPLSFREMSQAEHGITTTRVHARHRVVIGYLWEIAHSRRVARERRRRFRRMPRREA